MFIMPSMFFLFCFYVQSFMTIPQDILFQAQTRLPHTSSAAVCRKLSSVGRRVLSIESISNFQGHSVVSCSLCQHLISVMISDLTHSSPHLSTDGQESGEAIWHHSKSKRQSSYDISKDFTVNTAKKANGLSRQQVGFCICLHKQSKDIASF